LQSSHIGSFGGRIAVLQATVRGLAQNRSIGDSMLYRLRQRISDERGFTLIELLVVILIIGILAAIAIPAFLNQKSKANDAAAKSQARTLETAAETYSTDNNGAYTSMTTAELEKYEPTLKDHTTATPNVASASSSSYKVESTSVSTSDKFSIERNSNGEIVRECSPKSKGGCPSSGDW
jgi:type IV pilus assembly protein PilA